MRPPEPKPLPDCCRPGYAGPVDPATPQRWRDAAFGAVWGLLGLLWAFVPEIVAGVLGGIVGLLWGVIAGTGLTATLFGGSGGGNWGHAGLIALIIPAFTFFGPILLGLFVGVAVLPSITLAIHALIILVTSKDRAATRRLVVLSSALGVFGPALFLGAVADQHGTGFVTGLLFAPATGLFGLLAGAAYCGARSTLAGRSIAQWWKDADASMGIAMVTTSLVVWLGTWIPMLIFLSFPIVFAALPIAIVLGARLLQADNGRTRGTAVLVINLLHALLFGWVLVSMVRGEPPA